MPDDNNDTTKKVMEAFDAFKAANDENLKKRDVLLEEQTARINKVLDGYEGQNQALVQAQNVQKQLQEQMDRIEAAQNRAKVPGAGDPQDAKAKEFRAAWEHCLRRHPEHRDAAQVQQYRNALVKSDDTGAGYLQLPAEVERDIIKDVLLISPFRSLATVRSIGSQSLKQPRRTATAGAATRVGETQPRVNTGDPAYGMIEIPASELFARAEISQQMLEDMDYDLVGELRGEFSDQFALKEGQEFLSGSGANGQAEGLLVNSGINYVPSGDATHVTADGLITVFYTLKSVYARNASWILKRQSIGEIRKLKDSYGQYLWQPGIAGAQPNTILNATYTEMPDMPDIGAGTFPIAFGDFARAYVVVDRLGLSFQPDYITGADQGIVVYRARKRVGGGVRQTEPVLKLKIATS